MKLVRASNFAWPLLALNITAMYRVHIAAIEEGNQYKLGAKIPLGTNPKNAGKLRCDCSGWVRDAVSRHGTAVWEG